MPHRSAIAPPNPPLLRRGILVPLSSLERQLIYVRQAQSLISAFQHTASCIRGGVVALVDGDERSADVLAATQRQEVGPRLPGERVVTLVLCLRHPIGEPLAPM
eukprot:CAMPEP_0182805422 /NCGR_PEP_ID=MMETSP0006_2-20121128/5065_1 /TAXON_ID=97485 /ORGANISM="Prymnesium parvum, Strain Texoma1" /LENGTH=103 /DNA_ID=CAMNT_0024930985 /DNA_START=1036 /DNA_END=1345 /DNA_ORIENTATION=+